MTEEELNQIEKRCSNARSGPWKSFVEGRDHSSGTNFIMVGPSESRGTDIELIGATIADQDFVAHARQDIPALFAEVRALRKAQRD